MLHQCRPLGTWFSVVNTTKAYRRITTVRIAFLCLTLAKFVAGASPVQVVLQGAVTNSSFNLALAATAITMKCVSGPLRPGGIYSWSRSFGDTGCGNLIAGLTSDNVTTPLTTANVTCYQCTYSYIDAIGTKRTIQSDPLFLYPYQPMSSDRFIVDLATAAASVEVNCSFQMLSPSVSSPRFVWSRASSGPTRLTMAMTTGEKLSTLVINNTASSGDMYYCHGVVGNLSVTGNITNGIIGVLVATYEVRAPPAAAMLPLEAVGGKYIGTCTAFGYPTPTAMLLKNEVVVSSSLLQSVQVVGGTSLRFNVPSASENSLYTCVAKGIRNSSDYYSNDTLRLGSSAVEHKAHVVLQRAVVTANLVLSSLLARNHLIL